MAGAGLIFYTTTTGQSSFYNSSQGPATNLNAAANSYWNGSVYYPDVMRNPFNIGIGVTASSSGSTYNVEVSWDDYTLTTFTASAGNWYPISGLSSAAQNQTGNIAYPVRMVRLNTVTGSSTVVIKMSLIQAAGD